MMNNVVFVGCGAILGRHVEAVISNPEKYSICGFYDIDQNLSQYFAKKYSGKNYMTFDEIIKDSECNFISILTPNSLHVEQAEKAIIGLKSVLVEKPVSLKPKDSIHLGELAEEKGVKAYCVLQVRLNHPVTILQNVLNQNLLGNIRGVSLVQRWQRPLNYFNGWRSIPEIGGGTLHECGIHYLDILQYLFGVPKIKSSSMYNTKHKNVEIEDMIYATMDYGDYGGAIEITIAAEPMNLECSISVLGSNGYVKLGGKSLNIIESAKFLSNGCQEKFKGIQDRYDIDISPNKYGSYEGSCPNHGELYRNIDKFEIKESYNVLGMIDEIYKKSDMEY